MCKTGMGYELCKTVCKQFGHAEINAVDLAGEDAICSTLYLEGNNYICDNCKKYAVEHGIIELVIGEPK
jgi:deoxycytidylate deaminase